MCCIFLRRTFIRQRCTKEGWGGGVGVREGEESIIRCACLKDCWGYQVVQSPINHSPNEAMELYFDSFKRLGLADPSTSRGYPMQ